jgi:beta-glucosidase
MSAFNDLNGIPATGNAFLMNEILRKRWGFEGFVVSDWASIKEMIAHGYAENKYEAGKLAMHAGIDMDMMGHVYNSQLDSLFETGLVTEKQIDEAVKRILRIKFKLGLFDDPYKYCDEQKEDSLLLHSQHREFARRVARESFVLLKNDNKLLPLSKSVKNLAIIGPLAKNQNELLGNWRAQGEAQHAVSMYEGLKKAVSSQTNISYAKGCDIEGNDRSGFADAVSAVRYADVAVVVVGESAMMSGEAYSRAKIDLPGVQKELVQAIHQTGTPLVVVLMNGRPLAIPWLDENVDAILETWLPGTEGGNAIADVLLGDYNPSGKLPVTFPRHVGQVPIFYSHKNTGRPYEEDYKFSTKYIDMPVSPLYPFGYGLSYTDFAYSDISLSKEQLNRDEELEVSVKVTNTGDLAGKETVQLYIRDMFASMTQPVKLLKAFEKVKLEPGETKEILFTLDIEDLGFHNEALEKIVEPGMFKVFVGTNSRDVRETNFELL